MVRCRRRFNRTEDLDVKVSKEALSSAIRSGWCSKDPATGHGRPQGQEGRTGLEAIARHCHAAIIRGGDDCRHDAGDRLTAALGAWLPGRRGAQAPQAQAWLEEGGWDPGVPGCQPGTAASPALAAPSASRPESPVPRIRIGPALPDRKSLDAEIARLRDLGVSELRSRWHTVFGRQPPPHLPRHLLFRVLAYRLQAISSVTWTPRPYACSIAPGLPRRRDSMP